MEYTKYIRPNGRAERCKIDLGPRSEKLAKLCVDHDLGRDFTYEDCGSFISLCFEGYEDISDPDEDGEEFELSDLVMEIISHEQDLKAAFEKLVAMAADTLSIHVGDYA